MIIFHMRGHLSFSQFWFSIYGFYKIVTQSVYPSIYILNDKTLGGRGIRRECPQAGIPTGGNAHRRECPLPGMPTS